MSYQYIYFDKYVIDIADYSKRELEALLEEAEEAVFRIEDKLEKLRDDDETETS